MFPTIIPLAATGHIFNFLKIGKVGGYYYTLKLLILLSMSGSTGRLLDTGILRLDCKSVSGSTQRALLVLMFGQSRQ
ncbi:hypothetical protein L1987_03781 [Smallanthus sonchifolius]|uniref:Uncharacterized protein n=1 Tax=Smallanthus sonchifolius TaxID=185202 RepID=A0ACB9KBM4_9ASTR|nr:hypothetical protein L1987_03781 [Smallanthus sonchifolius]